MRIYLDSSALIKRVINEKESTAFIAELDKFHESGHLTASASLAWVEIARTLRVRNDASYQYIADLTRDAMLGVAEIPLSAGVMNLARRIEPNLLRSLDAIHLAAAIEIDADLLVTYDDRLATSAELNGIHVAAPT